MPPYTTSSAGFSATSGSRLFCSIRNGASDNQDLQLSWSPRGARMVRLGSLRVDIGGSGTGERDYPSAPRAGLAFRVEGRDVGVAGRPGRRTAIEQDAPRAVAIAVPGGNEGGERLPRLLRIGRFQQGPAGG